MNITAFILAALVCFSSLTAAEDLSENTEQTEKATENSVDISKYTESEYCHVEEIITTEYGTVLYLWYVGTPHKDSPYLLLVREDGSEINLSENVPREGLWNKPTHDSITLSPNGKALTFSVSFSERAAFNLAEEETLLHEAGTYYFEADLEAGTCVQTAFVPLETAGIE